MINKKHNFSFQLSLITCYQSKVLNLSLKRQFFEEFSKNIAGTQGVCFETHFKGAWDDNAQLGRCVSC